MGNDFEEFSMAANVWGDFVDPEKWSLQRL